MIRGCRSRREEHNKLLTELVDRMYVDRERGGSEAKPQEKESGGLCSRDLFLQSDLDILVTTTLTTSII